MKSSLSVREDTFTQFNFETYDFFQEIDYSGVIRRKQKESQENVAYDFVDNMDSQYLYIILLVII